MRFANQRKKAEKEPEKLLQRIDEYTTNNLIITNYHGYSHQGYKLKSPNNRIILVELPPESITKLPDGKPRIYHILITGKEKAKVMNSRGLVVAFLNQEDEGGKIEHEIGIYEFKTDEIGEWQCEYGTVIDADQPVPEGATVDGTFRV